MSADVQTWICNELFHQVPVSIGVIDRNFKVIEANRKFIETYGPPAGRRCYECYKGRIAKCDSCGADKTFIDGKTRVREERGMLRDGVQHYYYVHIIPMTRPDGSVPYIIEMSADITDMKKLEREKFESERLAAVGQTVAGLAHGIKNIIMGLEGGVYVMGSGIERGDHARTKKGWEMLQENIARISAFAKEFLNFARGAEPHVSLVNPNSIVEKVISLFRDKACLAGIRLNPNLQKDIAPAPMDEEGIHTCLANLISNALDACEVSEKANPQITVSTCDSKGVLIFQVVDNGCGMDYEVKQKVFTNYFSTKGSGQGTGLGLLTTRKIVQEHGGRVSVDSKLSVGSTFSLVFPRDRLPRLKPDAGAGVPDNPGAD